MKESFKPVAHHPPDSFVNTVKFYGRLILDFQTLTIYLHLREWLPQMKNNLLDVGCGNSPFKFLIDSDRCTYTGIDIEGADHFDYKNSNIIIFDGQNIPFPDDTFENVLCTEVIEHIPNPEKIIHELHRVMTPKGTAVITLPWSARIHFIPFDFCRYTPYKLSLLFSRFSEIEIINRGTDINSIVSKMIVLYFANLTNWKFQIADVLYWPLKFFWLIAFTPLLILAVIISHISLWFNIGSINDPLGYTIKLKK